MTLVRSVQSALALLRYLADAPPQGVNAIARAFDLSPSSCFNLLKTLEYEGLVSIDPNTKKYALEPLLSQYFSVAPRMNEWFQWLEQALSTIAIDYSLSVGLWQAQGDRLVLIEVMESPIPMRVHLAKGQRVPIYVGAMGRCVAAVEQKPKESIPRLISRLRWQIMPTADTFWDGICHVRKHGWALDQNNFIRGLTTVAVPVRATEKSVRYCISAIGFTAQHDAATLAVLGERLADVATEAERKWAALARR